MNSLFFSATTNDEDVPTTPPPQNTAVFVPCFPSTSNREDIRKLPVKYIDNPTLWTDIKTTYKSYKKLATTIRYLTLTSLIVNRDKHIIGFMTLSNQFIQITPPVPVAQTPKYILKLNLPKIEYTNLTEADAILQKTTNALGEEEDIERTTTLAKIETETHLYNLFRIHIRTLIHPTGSGAGDARKNALYELIHLRNISSVEKQKRMEARLRELSKGRVEFTETATTAMSNTNNNAPFITTGTTPTVGAPITNTNAFILILPNTTTVNDKIYYGKLADELIRNTQIRYFMFNINTRLTTGNTQYEINENEFVATEGKIDNVFSTTKQIFNKNPYIKKTNYDVAIPENQQGLGQQYEAHATATATAIQPTAMTTTTDTTATPIPAPIIDGETDEDTTTTTCFIKKNVMGNNVAGIWVNTFPHNTKELFIKPAITDTTSQQQQLNCSYIMILDILRKTMPLPPNAPATTTYTIENIKQTLWDEYDRILKTKEDTDKYSTLLSKEKCLFIGEMNKYTDWNERKQFLRTSILGDGAGTGGTYCLTTVDIMLYARIYNLPIVLFNMKLRPFEKYIKNINKKYEDKDKYPLHFFILGKPEDYSVDKKYWFLRVPTIIDKPCKDAVEWSFVENVAFNELRGDLIKKMMDATADGGGIDETIFYDFMLLK